MASAVDTDAQRAPGGSDLVAETPAPASGTPAAPAQPTGTTATTTGSGSGHGDGGQDDDDDDGHLASSMMSLTSVTSPPYWLNSGVHQHQRSASRPLKST